MKWNGFALRISAFAAYKGFFVNPDSPLPLLCMYDSTYTYTPFLCVFLIVQYNLYSCLPSKLSALAIDYSKYKAVK